MIQTLHAEAEGEVGVEVDNINIIISTTVEDMEGVEDTMEELGW